MSKYKEEASFIQSFGKIEKLIIMDSQLYIIPNTVFAPKEYAKYIKIKNSKFEWDEQINNFNVPSIIKFIGGSSVLQALNLCINEENISSYTQLIT